MPGDFLQAFNHIAKTLFIGEAASETGEGNHAGKTRSGALVDSLTQYL